MPCMGPVNPSDEEIDRATNEVLTLLRSNYRVHGMDDFYKSKFWDNRKKEDILKLREIIQYLLIMRNGDEF